MATFDQTLSDAIQGAPLLLGQSKVLECTEADDCETERSLQEKCSHIHSTEADAFTSRR
jgi:hypothetical protein